MRDNHSVDRENNNIDYKFIIFISVLTIIFIILIPELLYLVIIVVAIILIKKGQNNEEVKEKNKKEEAKLNELKIKMLENQKKLRDIKQDSKNMNEKQKNKQINDVLEDMCIYGTVTKKEIREEKIKNPEKFIETSQALKMENKDDGLFALGLISNNLEKLGIETAIEIDQNQDEQDAGSTCLQFISNGMINKKNMICTLNSEIKEMKNY